MSSESRNVNPLSRMAPPTRLGRSALAVLLSLAVFATGAAHGQTRIVLKNLPGVVPADHSAISLDLIQSLVEKQGLAKIRGFYANSGVNFPNPGQVRAFELIPPIPSPIDINGNPSMGIFPLTVTFEPPLANLNLLHANKPGPHSVRVSRNFGVLAASSEYLPSGPPAAQLATFVSVFDPITQSFDPFSGTIDTPVFPVLGGRVSEGSEFFSTFTPSGRKRFVAVNNYHEGTLTLIDWTDSSAPTAFAEYRLNMLPADICDPIPPSLTKEGNHNRGVAVVQPPTGPWAGRTLVMVTLNYDPFGVDCNDIIDPDTNSDEGASHYLVILDVTGLDPTLPAPPLGNLLALDPPLWLGDSIQGTLTSLCVHPDQDVVYVVSRDQHKTGSPGEDAYLYAVDLTADLAMSPTGVSQVMIEGMDASLAGFAASGGRSVTIRNPNLPSAVTDRLYIGTNQFGPMSIAPDSAVLVLDITGATNKLDPMFLRLVILPGDGMDGEIWQVQDLVAAPVNSNFLGTDLERNVLFGIVRDGLADPPEGGRLLVLEDR